MKLFLYCVLSLLFHCRLEARPVYVPSVAELTSTASYVVIIEPQSMKQTTDTPDDGSFGSLSMTNYVPLETTFRVQAVLKGELPEKTLKIVHFQYAHKMDFNVPVFITFFFPPWKLATVPAGKDGKIPSEALTNHAYAEGTPQYLAFLRRLPDGRFAAVTPQYEAGLSFKVLTSPQDNTLAYRHHPATRPTSPEEKTDNSSK